MRHRRWERCTHAVTHPLCPRSHMRAQPFRTAVLISAAEDNFVALVIAAFTAFGGTENWGPVDMYNPLQWLLFYAVQSTNSSTAMVRVLLDNGAAPAPLMLAVAVRPDDIALLLASGARADVPCKNVYADAKRLPIGHALARGKVSRSERCRLLLFNQPLSETQLDIATTILHTMSKEALQNLVSAPHDTLNA